LIIIDFDFICVKNAINLSYIFLNLTYQLKEIIREFLTTKKQDSRNAACINELNSSGEHVKSLDLNVGRSRFVM